MMFIIFIKDIIIFLDFHFCSNMLIITFVLFVVSLASGRSPHADDVEKLVRSSGFRTRISDNVFEDARLDVVSDFLIHNFPQGISNIEKKEVKDFICTKLHILFMVIIQ